MPVFGGRTPDEVARRLRREKSSNLFNGGAVVGAFAYIFLEDVLKGMTEHWLVIFGPLLLLIVLFGKGGIWGYIPAGRPLFGGGPFSGRTPFPDPATGTPSDQFPENSFANPLPLPRVKRLAWTVRLLGAAAVPEVADNPLATSQLDVDLRAARAAAEQQRDERGPGHAPAHVTSASERAAVTAPGESTRSSCLPCTARAARRRWRGSCRRC